MKKPDLFDRIRELREPGKENSLAVLRELRGYGGNRKALADKLGTFQDFMTPEELRKNREGK